VVTAPALNPRLDSARAKWDRAKFHAEQLVAEMKEACDGDRPRVTRTSRRFDSETNEIVWTAESIVPEIAPHWPLMIGECVYNLRCALDHLWWELAIDDLGREPTEDEARAIQFPIYTRSRPESFESQRFLTHVASEAVQKAREVQVFDRPEGTEALLGVLADLSNHDKHRKIQPTYFRPIHVETTIGNATCVDCHVPRSGEGDSEWVATIEFPDWEGVEVGDEVLRQEVVPTGPNPDIDHEPQINLIVGFGPEGSVTVILKKLGLLVHRVIVEFAPLVKE
jgi:hypothetical protein